MEIKMSKTEWRDLMTLIDRAVAVIKKGEPTPREYNVARRLRLLRNKIYSKNL